MINRVVLVGRLTRDIELRKTTSGLSTCTFTLACDRRFVSKDNNGPTADFISCVAWRQQADFLSNYARKGSVVAVDGHITTRSYDGQNGKVYVTEVTCENVRLIGSNPNNNTTTHTNETYTPSSNIDTYESQDDFGSQGLEISSDDLPFY